MVTKSPTKPSTLRLSDTARHIVVPSGIVTTGWPQVAAKGLELGIGFDWWQHALGRIVLGKREDGKYAATVGGITLSIPRQVGKTYFVGALLIILCILFPGLKVVWTAHRTRTSTNTFRSLQGMVKRKKVWPHILSIRTANGEQEISFRNGSVIMFGAREQGFGRGFDELDVEVFDEAQILTEKALEDMVAATNQARHPHGALLFYMGTPPRLNDPGEAFTLKRSKALSGKSNDLLYLECSADFDCDPDDYAQWIKANFSYPTRTPHESMLRLRENLLSDEAWRREALGIWDDLRSNSAFDYEIWSRLGAASELQTRGAHFGLATAPDRSWSCLAAAWFRSDGIPQLSVVRYDRGTAWVEDEASRLRPRPVVDVASRGLVRDALEVSQQDQAKAHNALADAVAAGQVRHDDVPELNVSVRASQWRPLGDTRLLDRKGSADISPLVAAALALQSLREHKPRGRVINLAEVMATLETPVEV